LFSATLRFLVSPHEPNESSRRQNRCFLAPLQFHPSFPLFSLSLFLSLPLSFSLFLSLSFSLFLSLFLSISLPLSFSSFLSSLSLPLSLSLSSLPHFLPSWLSLPITSAYQATAEASLCASEPKNGGIYTLLMQKLFFPMSYILVFKTHFCAYSTTPSLAP
jgi:hypothetical protein